MACRNQPRIPESKLILILSIVLEDSVETQCQMENIDAHILKTDCHKEMPAFHKHVVTSRKIRVLEKSLYLFDMFYIL